MPVDSESLVPNCNDLSVHYDIRVRYGLSVCVNGEMD